MVQGAASWYGPGFYGRTTANGERFSKGTLTAAHRTLPFGTKVRVTNLSNGRSVVVRINDRGPFKYHRVIDLAHGAASQLQDDASGGSAGEARDPCQGKAIDSVTSGLLQSA